MVEIRMKRLKVCRGMRDCAEFWSKCTSQSMLQISWEGMDAPSVSLLRKDSRASSKEPRILKSHFSSPSLTTNSANGQRDQSGLSELPLTNLRCVITAYTFDTRHSKLSAHDKFSRCHKSRSHVYCFSLLMRINIVQYYRVSNQGLQIINLENALQLCSLLNYRMCEILFLAD